MRPQRSPSVGAKKPSTLKKKGRVLAQKPRVGKKLTNGAKVNLTVGKGPRGK